MKDFFFIFLTLLVPSISRSQNIGRNKLTTYFSWKEVDYAFPGDAPAEYFIKSGEFIPRNMIILDASVYEDVGGVLKTFVSTPRMRKGTPASFSIVNTTKTRNGQYLLQPYPDWSWHRQNLNVDQGEDQPHWAWNGIDCEKMISVFRSAIDSSCGRLWVLDTGFLHAVNKQVCPPKVLIFDLQTDKLVGKYIFPKDVASKTSLLITIAVDVRNNQCNDAFAYIADVVDYKLVVYDHKRKSSWSMESNLFYPYPLQGFFDLNGVQFDLMDGLFGLAVGPLENNDRKLYFHSLASIRESWVQTSVVRNQSLFPDGENKAPRLFKVFNETRSTQSAAQDMNEDGILFFGLLAENSIACWNSRLPYRQQNIETVAQNDEEIQFSSGLKVNNGKVWVTTSRFPKFFTGVMDFSETNFRILGAPVKDLVRGTSCSARSLPPLYSTFRPSFQESTAFQFTFPSYNTNRRYTQL